MIRLKEFKEPPDLKKAWKSAFEPAMKAALADFRTWPLYQRAGEAWPDAPKKFVRVTSRGAVTKGLRSSATEALEKGANPALRAMYQNLSTLLNVRSQFFHEQWRADIIWRATEKALAELTKRQNWKPSDSEKGFWLYGPNTCLWQHVWEQLHPRTIEAPFHEHHVTILRSGHVPAGLQGKDWKTCQYLYY